MDKAPNQALCMENFANDLRMQLLTALKEKKRNVSELVGLLGAERTRVSHELINLKKCSLIQAKRQGREIIYSLSKHSPLEEKGNFFELVEKHVQHNCATCHKCAGQ